MGPSADRSNPAGISVLLGIQIGGRRLESVVWPLGDKDLWGHRGHTWVHCPPGLNGAINNSSFLFQSVFSICWLFVN